MPDVKALGSVIHYQESGSGTPFAFLHGNPSSSYRWREVLPRVGSPTLLITGAMAAWCASRIAALETAHCGKAGHHAPEDRPAEIAAAISAWADRHGLR